jgi:hypothetical protein
LGLIENTEANRYSMWVRLRMNLTLEPELERGTKMLAKTMCGLVILFAGMMFLTTVQVLGQGGLGDGLGGNGIDPDALTGDIINAVNSGGGVGGGNTTQNQFTGGDGASGTGGSDFQNSEFMDTEIMVVPNERQLGFVGATVNGSVAMEREFQFVGPRLESSSAGGGATGGGLGTVGGGLAGSLSGGLGGLGGLGTASTLPTSGFEVVRPSPIRAQIVPRFIPRPVASSFVASRVNQRINSLPATRQFASSMNVAIQGRTAIITGTARNQEQVNRIQRQLRLEPGISRVESRVVFAR